MTGPLEHLTSIQKVLHLMNSGCCMLKTASSCLLLLLLTVQNDMYKGTTCLKHAAEKKKCWPHDNHCISVAYIL